MFLGADAFSLYFMIVKGLQAELRLEPCNNKAMCEVHPQKCSQVRPIRPPI